MIHHDFRTILGSIPQEWEEISLRDCLICHQSGDWGDDNGETDLKVIRSTNFSNTCALKLDDVAVRGFSPNHAAKFNLKKGDILVERSGGGPTQPVGRVVLIPEDMPDHGFSNFVQLLRPNSEIMDADYLIWCLHQLHRCGAIEQLQHQTTQMRNLDFRDYLRVKLPKPPKNEQERIGRAIRAADTAQITAQKELIAARNTKESLLQTLFTQGMPEYHAKFKDAKIGRIPSNWEVVSLGQHTTIDSGVTLNQDRAPRKSAFQYLTVINVQRGVITVDEPRFMELHVSEIPKKLLTEQDILVVEGHANSTEIGRAAMVGPDHVGMSFQNHLFRIRTCDDSLNPRFLLHVMNSRYAQRHWNAICNTSSGLNTLNRRQLRKFPLIKPHRDEQDRILDVIDSAEDTVSALEHKLIALGQVKISLLQNLLTGRMRIFA